jgi:hypothetical protein
MSFFDQNARDKLIIIALMLLGAGCLIGTYFGKTELKEGVMIVITALAAAFKGNPSPVAPADADASPHPGDQTLLPAGAPPKKVVSADHTLCSINRLIPRQG